MNGKSFYTRLIFIIAFSIQSLSVCGQVSGSSTVCAGYIYTYKVTMPGAVTFTWKLPTGWYFLSGQGTDSIKVDCNDSVGSVCVTGYDTASKVVNTVCETVSWGGGYGWNVTGTQIGDCSTGYSYILNVVPSGSCGTGGCGSGYPNPNVFFAVFDNQWPSGNYLGPVNGVNAYSAPGQFSEWVYVYEVDTTFGVMKLVKGGPAGCNVDNEYQLPPGIQPDYTQLYQFPDPVCVGDTFVVWPDLSSYNNANWNPLSSNVKVISSSVDSAEVVVTDTSSIARLEYFGSDFNGCPLLGYIYIDYKSCAVFQPVITGSDTVCPAYIYTYATSMPGAVTYKWYLPTGWYFISGQGTDSVKVNCNQSIGSICVAGYDTAGKVVDSVCTTVVWGGGGPSWQVTGNQLEECPYQVYALSIAPLGNSCGSGGCGNGTPNPNIIYAAFDNPWPNGNYLGYVNGINGFDGGIYGMEIYVYVVDTTFGLKNMILVQGGTGCPPLNTFYIPGPPSYYVNLYQEPNPACLGDTFVVYVDNPFLYGYWYAGEGMISANYDSAVFVITDSSISSFYVSYFGTTWDGCPFGGDYYGEIVICHQPTAQFSSNKTSLCAGSSSCVSYTDHSTNNPTQWRWLFTGGSPSSSSAQNPSICYSTSGIYPVTLITSNSYGSDSITFNNYVTVNAPPVVTASPDTSVCSGSGVQLLASGGITYLWSPSTSLNNKNISNPYATPTITTDYNVVATDIHGCTASAFADVIVNSLPLVQTSHDTSLCHGSSAQLTASGGNTYAWSPSSGLTDSTIANPVASPAATTSYTVAVSNALLCKASGTVKITVNPLPAVSISSDTSLCYGSSVQLTASGGVSYAWTSSLGLNNSTISNPVANPAVSTSYSVNVTNAYGCEAGSAVNITVNPLPVVSITPDTSLCIGSSVQLSASGGINYSWSPSMGLNDTTISNPFANPSVSTNYQVIVTDGNGCNGNGTVAVNVYPLTTAIVSPDTTVCMGSVVQLFASGGSSYIWSPSYGLSDTTIANPFGNPATSTIYAVQVTDSNMCQASNTLTITVNPLPVIGLNSDTSLCYGSFIQLTATGGIYYSWTPSTGLSDTMISNPVAFPLITTSYSVDVTDTNACTGSRSITLTIDPITPTPHIKQEGSILYCSTDPSYVSYQWYDDTTLIVGATDTFYVALHDGNYNVAVTDVNACEISAGINVNILSTNNYSDEVVSIFPNPAGNQLAVSSSQLAVGDWQLVIDNVLGQRKLQIAACKLPIVLDVSMLEPGIYFIEMKCRNGNVVKKFVKE